jgi:small conductance mechanosensitive channel
MLTSINKLLNVHGSVGRIAVILCLAAGSHIGVLLVKRLVQYLVSRVSEMPHSKFRSIASLTESFLIFVLYFSAFGLVLRESGISLKAYMASASVIGLAVGFGSQGLVQDVVTGLTLVLPNLMDVGDLVDIGGQVGIVRSIGMRFTVLRNPLGANVYIPNRSITGVINYPRGYVRCMIDVTLPSDRGTHDTLRRAIEGIIDSFGERFAGILIRSSSIETTLKTTTGREYLRIKFRIWPGRGDPLTTVFKQELLLAMKEIDDSYADWMISVNFEVEKSVQRK